MTDAPQIAEPGPDERRWRPRRRWRSAEEVRTRRRRIVTWALLVASLGLVVNALVGDNGYLTTVRRRQQYDALMATLTRLQAENQQLLESIQFLHTREGLEEAARSELGMIRPGETLVVVKDVRPAAPAEPPH